MAGGMVDWVRSCLRESMMPTDRAHWRMCIHAVETAKNRLSNRSGFSPAQRQIGFNLGLPGSLASDDVYDPSLLQGSENFVKHMTSEAVQRAQRARGRTTSTIAKGEIVYVYRVPLQRRRRHLEGGLLKEDMLRSPREMQSGRMRQQRPV